MLFSAVKLKDGREGNDVCFFTKFATGTGGAFELV